MPRSLIHSRISLLFNQFLYGELGLVPFYSFRGLQKDHITDIEALCVRISSSPNPTHYIILHSREA